MQNKRVMALRGRARAKVWLERMLCQAHGKAARLAQAHCSCRLVGGRRQAFVLLRPVRPSVVSLLRGLKAPAQVYDPFTYHNVHVCSHMPGSFALWTLPRHQIVVYCKLLKRGRLPR